LTEDEGSSTGQAHWQGRLGSTSFPHLSLFFLLVSGLLG
jgi:hypothetical protein